MLQSLTRNARLQRPLARPSSRSLVTLAHWPYSRAALKPTLIHIRFLSTPDSSTDSHSSQKPSELPPSALHQRKSKVGLRPGPVKPPPTPRPSTLSVHHVPLHPTSPPHKPPTSASAPPLLNEVKETTKRDIEQAEAHGILIPPPPNANWFRRTMHKGIQLAVRIYTSTFLSYLLTPLLRNSTSEALSSSSSVAARFLRFAIGLGLVELL